MKTTIVIIGPTGAGKDTQARLLVEKHNYHLIDAGNLIRQCLKIDPELTDQIARGLLVDDRLVNDLVATEIDALDPADRLISDGFPRRLAQAEWFDQYLAEAGRRIDSVIYLSLDPTSVLARLAKRGRADDQESVVKQRLAVFESTTEPVIEFYRQRNLIHEIKADQSIKDIHVQIVELLR